MPDRDKILRMGDYVVVLPGKSPDEVFLMSLCLVTSIPILLGIAPPPGSIEANMHRPLVVGWSLALALGASVILASFLIKDRVTGMIVEQFGAVCLGSAAAVYGVVIFVTSHDDGGAVPSAIIIGFAAARFLQVRAYQKTLNKIQRVRQLIVQEEGNGH